MSYEHEAVGHADGTSEHEAAEASGCQYFYFFYKPAVANKLSTKIQIMTPDAAEAAAARTDDGGKTSRKQLAPGLSLLHDIAAKKVLLYSIYSFH